MSMITGNIPAGTTLGIQWFGYVPHDPGLDLAAIGAPSCAKYCDPREDVFLSVTGPTASVPVVIPNHPGLAGLRVYSQSLTFTGGLNPLGILFTNGLDLKLDVH